MFSLVSSTSRRVRALAAATATVIAIAAGLATFTLTETPAAAYAGEGYCAESTGATPGSDWRQAFQDDTNAEYGPVLEGIADRLGLNRDTVCKVGSELIEEGASSIALGVAGGRAGEFVCGPESPARIEQQVCDHVFDHAVEQALEGDDPNNPLLVPVGPEEGSTSTVTMTVADDYLGGTFGRSNTDGAGGVWFRQDQPPADSSTWYSNGAVDVECTLPGAPYTVHFRDGHTEVWGYWLRTAEQLYIPAATVAEVGTSAQPDVALC